jgi:hypothetical protein
VVSIKYLVHLLASIWKNHKTTTAYNIPKNNTTEFTVLSGTTSSRKQKQYIGLYKICNLYNVMLTKLGGLFSDGFSNARQWNFHNNFNWINWAIRVATNLTSKVRFLAAAEIFLSSHPDWLWGQSRPTSNQYWWCFL